MASNTRRSPREFSFSRRQWLRSTFAGGLASQLPLLAQASPAPRPKRRVAGIVTEYRRFSHADVVIGKILNGWRQDGGDGPDLELVSLYTDQVPDGDLSRGLGEKHGFPLAKTIDEALTLGTDELVVDGVLSIGEHGDYPYTPDTKQHMYPRRRFFDQIVATMQRCQQFVPLFNDKHLGYRWQDAKHMFDTANQLGIPLMAGSSLPVAWRYPRQELPIGSHLNEVLAIGYGGLEAYGFHALETLQCLAERRHGGETGVKSVTVAQGDAIWQAAEKGYWSKPLLDAALATFGESGENLRERLEGNNAAFYLIEYSDGLRGTVAMLNGIASEFAAACQIQGQATPFANWFRLEDTPHGHFEHLLRAIEQMVHTKKPAYPVERTLLTTGILDRVMHSVQQGGQTLMSPELEIHYQPSAWPFANLREENYPS